MKICRPRWTKLNILGDDVKNPLSKSLLGYDQKRLHTNCSRTKEQSYNRQRHPRGTSTKVNTALKATGQSCIREAKIKQIINPYRPVAQRYIEQLTESLPLAQWQVFRSYLRPYLDRIPFYLETKGNSNDKSTMTTIKAGTMTATTKSLKRP